MYLHYTSLSLTHWPAYPEDNFHTNTGNIQLTSTPVNCHDAFSTQGRAFGSQTLEKHVGGYAKVPEWLERDGFFKGTGTNVINFNDFYGSTCCVKVRGRACNYSL